MKVRSPVGEFPFETKRIRIRAGRIVLEGSMGAWPATVEIEPADLPRLVGVIPRPWLITAGVAAAGLLAGCRARLARGR